MKLIHSETHYLTISILQKQNKNILTCAVFRCQSRINHIKKSLNFSQTQKSPKSKVIESKDGVLKLAIFPLLILIALSCCAPTMGASTTAYLRSPTTTNFTLTNSFHGNVSSPTKKSSGLRTVLPKTRVPMRRKSRRTGHPNRKYQRSRSIKPKMRRRKTKGKERKRKRCKKKRKNSKKCKNNSKEKKNKESTKTDSTIRRMYSKSGNSFHLAVLQNGTVKGELSHIRSDYS